MPAAPDAIVLFAFTAVDGVHPTVGSMEISVYDTWH